MPEDIKVLDIAELRAGGYLQEANRLFFHPLGLALSVEVDGDGTERLGAVWDDREDIDGNRFGAGMLDPAKAEKVAAEREAKRVVRAELYGWADGVQPVAD